MGKSTLQNDWEHGFEGQRDPVSNPGSAIPSHEIQTKAFYPSEPEVIENGDNPQGYQEDGEKIYKAPSPVSGAWSAVK